MSLLSVFKKKKAKTMDLPPPPMPVDQDMPELPEIEAPPAPDVVQPPVEPSPLPQQQEWQAPPAPEPIREPEPTFEMPQEITPPEMSPMETVTVDEPEAILPRRDPVSPLFVSTNDYQAILDGIAEIRTTLGDSENILSRLTEIKNTQEKVFSNWKTHLEDIERKISYVDAIIAKSQ